MATTNRFAAARDAAAKEEKAARAALNRLKGIDGLERSLVVREALDEWIASHAAEYPESLGQYGK